MPRKTGRKPSLRKRSAHARYQNMAALSQRAQYRDALMRLPDRLVQRVYEDMLAKGRRDLANWAAAEAGRRIEARRRITLPALRGEPISRAFMDALDAEWRADYCEGRREYHRVARTKARQRQRNVYNHASVGEPAHI